MWASPILESEASFRREWVKGLDLTVKFEGESRKRRIRLQNWRNKVYYKKEMVQAVFPIISGPDDIERTVADHYRAVEDYATRYGKGFDPVTGEPIADPDARSEAIAAATRDKTEPCQGKRGGAHSQTDTLKELTKLILANAKAEAEDD